MHVKKQKPQPKLPNVSADQSNEIDTLAEAIGSLNIGYGAVPPTYTIGSGSDTITIDPSVYSLNTAIVGGGSSYTIASGAGSGYNWGTTTQNTVHIDADGLTMKEGADIKIGGKSLSKAIEDIEARLGILRPNPELEDRWETLKDLRRQYMEMERDILEKEKIMKILKEK